MMYPEINSDKLCLHYEQVKAPQRASRYIVPVVPRPVSVNLRPARGAELEPRCDDKLLRSRDADCFEDRRAIDFTGRSRIVFLRTLPSTRLGMSETV